MFITFQGIQGSGKTTQSEKLYDWFKQNGFKALLTKQPGDNDLEINNKIRQLILGNYKMQPETQLMLFFADRSEHIRSVIMPALQKDIVVICDRFSDSTFAYQGGGRYISMREIADIDFIVTRGLKPDLTFLLDIPVKVGLERIKNKSYDRMEQQNIEFFNNVRKCYLQLAQQFSERIKVIDGLQSPDKINQQIITIIKKFYNIV